jgi:glutathione synthase/RimK-type ligase-like ATP-grasp enzyme
MVRAVWWRRPRPPSLHDAVVDLDRFAFAWREAQEALAGAFLSLRCRWVNHPEREAAAAHKPWQLALAARLGLPVPRSCVTSDPAAARAFLASLRSRPAVVKALQATPADWRPTRLVGPALRKDLPLLRRAPALLQEYVAGVDVRVTAVGRSLFAAAIDARATGSPEDFRPVFDESPVAPARLPADLARRLRALLRALGLAFAAVDLRRDEAGGWYFLEVNPAGQWLFVERRTGQRITEAVARLLATGR